MSKGSKQRPTDMDKFSSNWDNIFRKEKAVIRTPAQHNTEHPAGQISVPVGTVSPLKQEKPLSKEIDDYKNKPVNDKHGY